MANLFVTSKCNRHCTFCFARDSLWGREPSSFDVNLDEVEELARACAAENVGELGLVGGEPLLHPELPSIIEMLNQHRIIPKIFTSGTCEIPDRLVDISGASKFYFVTNLDVQTHYTFTEWQNLVQFFAVFSDRTKLGFTIADPSFAADYLIEYYEKYHLQPDLRVGIALPVFCGSNTHIRPEEYSAVADRLVKFLLNAVEHGLMPGFDCGFVACMFSFEQIGTMLRHGIRTQFVCNPVIDICSGLQASYCLPMANLKNASLRDMCLHDLHDMYSGIAERIRERVAPGIYLKCRGCRFLRRGQCSGGCLGMVLKLNGVAAESLDSLVAEGLQDA